MPLAAQAPPRDSRAEFPIFRHSIYLNSCSLGVLSTQVHARINGYLDLWEARRAAACYELWWAALAELRGRYARWIGAPEGSIALHPNISTALTAVAESLDYRRRPKVVVTSLDFPTLPYQWLARAREGIEVFFVNSPDGITVPVEAIVRAVDGRTALVATSSVFFTSGAIRDVRALANLVHGRGALLPVGVRALDADFYCGGGLKWLLGGTGGGVHIRPSGAVTHAGPAREWVVRPPRAVPLRSALARAARGCPPARGGHAAAHAGLCPARRTGVARRAGSSRDPPPHHGAGRGSDRARAAGLRPSVAAAPEDRTAIVMLPGPDPAAAVRRLAEGGIAADSRPGHVRMSPYFYNVPDDHRAAVECLTRDQ